MYQIRKSIRFEKKAKKFFKKHSNLIPRFKEIIFKLTDNPFHLSLKTHKLNGKLIDLYSCSLNYEYRIILNILIKDDEIILLDIGTQDEVY